ncbi:MAG: CPBP family glutamic-type intramembrane protease [Planctomycetota bacterium]
MDDFSPPSRPLAVLALAVFLALGAANVAQEVAGFSKAWIVGPAAAGVAVYVAVVASPAGGSRWRRWGIRRDNARAALELYGGLTLALGLGMLAFALAAGRPLRARLLLVLLALYPAWALAQQFCFQVVLREVLEALRAPAVAKVALIAALFSAVHAPDGPLMALTLGSGALWASLYVRVPNLVAVSLSHGILASLAFVWALGRDPLAALAGGGIG